MQKTQDNSRRGYLVAAAILLGLLLYGFTCAPGTLWQDSATFQLRVWRADLRGELGLALAHPLYILLAKVFTFLPLGSIPFRVNLFSAVCAAACLGVAIDLLMSMTRSRFAAVSGTTLLAISHTFWRHAVMAEVYSLYGLCLLIELWLFERFFSHRQSRWFVLAIFVNGLNVSNHLLAMLHLPAYFGIAIFALRSGRLHRRMLPLAVVAFCLGASPYLGLMSVDIIRGQPLLDTLHSALFGNSFEGKVLGLSFSPLRQTLRTFLFFLLNFPTPLLLAAPLGLWAAWKSDRTRWFCFVAGAIFTVSFVFAYRYLVPDQYVFFFPCYVLLPLFVAIAVPGLMRRSTMLKTCFVALAAFPAVAYECLPPLARHWNVPIGSKREIPFRDTYSYFLRPRKNGDNGADRFARAALDRATPTGLLIADSTIMNVLVFVRDVDGVGRRVTLTRTADTTPAPPAIALTPPTVRPFAERNLAFVCSTAAGYVRPWILDEYDAIPDGVVFRLKRKPLRTNVVPDR